MKGIERFVLRAVLYLALAFAAAIWLNLAGDRDPDLRQASRASGIAAAVALAGLAASARPPD